jgi:hypothetical protein
VHSVGVGAGAARSHPRRRRSVWRSFRTF